jgi:hypothetical protein
MKKEPKQNPFSSHENQTMLDQLSTPEKIELIFRVEYLLLRRRWYEFMSSGIR